MLGKSLGTSLSQHPSHRAATHVSWRHAYGEPDNMGGDVSTFGEDFDNGSEANTERRRLLNFTAWSIAKSTKKHVKHSQAVNIPDGPIPVKPAFYRIS